MSTVQSDRRTLQVPWVTLALILANFVASLLALLDKDVLDAYAFDPARPTVPTALVSLFLHANMVHLLGNMLFLAAVGPRVESVAGRWRFVAVYVAGGLCGVAAHWAVTRAIGTPSPLLGASGSIASCVGYSAVRFMNRKVPLAPRLNVTVGTVALVWVLLQAAGAFFRFGSATSTGTAFWSHLAGFIAGIALSIVFQAPKEASLQFGHELLDRMSERGPAALAEAAKRHLERHPDDSRALRDLAAAYRQMGDRGHEVTALVRLLAVTPQASQPSVLEDLAAVGGWSALPPLQRMKLAEAHGVEQPELSRRLLRDVIDDPSAASVRADALLALAQVEDEQNRGPLLAELQEKYALHAATEIARQKGLIR